MWAIDSIRSDDYDPPDSIVGFVHALLAVLSSLVPGAHLCSHGEVHALMMGSRAWRTQSDSIVHFACTIHPHQHMHMKEWS